MMLDRTKAVEDAFLASLEQSVSAKESPSDLGSQRALAWLESMILSRLLDLRARQLKATGKSFYTISSAGHESNVVFGDLLAKDDPCLLHYRSGALMMERYRLGERDRVMDTLFSMCASSHDPVSEGRHKVWGSKDLWVIPQTSTIASHLPKSVGMAWAIEKLKRSGLENPVSGQSVTFCSFGDASVNHASAQTAFNAVSWMRHSNLPLPLFFLCEDNGLGISVRTPADWIHKRFSTHPYFHYFEAQGIDLLQVFRQAQLALATARVKRVPVFFHLKTLRLFGHAGSDMESVYRSEEEILSSEKDDPLLHFARDLRSWSYASATDIRDLYLSCKQRIVEKSSDGRLAQHLSSGNDIASALFLDDKTVRNVSGRLETRRNDYYQSRSKELPESPGHKKRHMAFWINQSLRDLMIEHPELLIFGEDVAKKGGVYNVTTDLVDEFGGQRVFNTLLDEQMILGMAMGMGQMGFLPMPEIQYLAYYQNAQDQIRSEAASQSFFSNRQFFNPMVIRIASFAYQKGFGGHFHNDHSIASLLDLPGVVIATPSRGDDAAMMLRTLTHMAKMQGRICFFLEPIALYMTKHLHVEGDGLWECEYPSIEKSLELGQVSVYGPSDASIVLLSYANGLYMSLQAAKILKEKYQIDCKVVDLRWLKPLPWDSIEMIVKHASKVLLVDECREFGGPSDRILSHLINRGLNRGKTIKSIHAMDTYIPLGPSAHHVLLQLQDIVHAVVAMTQI
ncbi:MAG: thiamine pyrophosphate-dependent enzyme [Bdellovibrionota bacterium]